MKKTFTLSIIAALIFFTLGFVPNTTTYTLDVGHTYVGFEVERFMVGAVSGRFNEFSGSMQMEGEDYTTLKMEATINVESLDSNNETRDGHLKGDFWLDAQNHPNIMFTSTGVTKMADESYVMTGELTIKGITKTVEFPIEILGPFKDPTQQTTIGVKADFTIDRFDYGIQLSKKLANGSYFIGKDVEIKLRALAVQQ